MFWSSQEVNLAIPALGFREGFIETVTDAPHGWDDTDLCETFPKTNRRELTAGIRVALQFRQMFPLENLGMSIASRPVSVFISEASRQPTIIVQ